MAKKSGLPWMPMYVDNFIAACVAWGLSLEQEGAYNRLLLCTWNRKEPIPFDEREIAKVLGCTRHRWRTKLWPKLASFFDVSDGTLRQKKLEEVLEGAKNSRKNSENFDENEADSGPGNGRESEPLTHAGARDHQNQSDESKRDSSRGRATRLPPDFALPPDWVAAGYAARSREKLPEMDLDAEARRFVRHFAAKAGRKGLSLNWRLTWLNWCTSPYCGATNGAGPHANGHQRDLDRERREGLASAAMARGLVTG